MEDRKGGVLGIGYSMCKGREIVRSVFGTYSVGGKRWCGYKLEYC